MTQQAETNFTAFDGTNVFHRSWTPDGDASSAVMLVHGLGEHSGRYAHVGEALVAAGCAVHALDHRGHGRSDGKRAHVTSYDEFMADLVQFRSVIESQHAGLPLVMLGHSMGGNLALGHVLDHQDGVAGLALSGAALALGEDVSPSQVRMLKLVAKIAPGFRPQGLSADAISRDPDVVRTYLADPLVYNGRFSAGLGAALMGAMERFPTRYAELRLPVLVMHGTEDRLTEIEGSRTLERGAVNASITARYYDGLFHEIFNEPEQERVLGDLVAWIRDVVEPAA